MNKSKKLTIRIKFPSQVNNHSQEQVSSGCHWGRISGVCFLFILIIAAVIGCASYYSNQDNIVDKNVNSSTFTAPQASTDEYAAQNTPQNVNTKNATALDEVEKSSEQPLIQSTLIEVADSQDAASQSAGEVLKEMKKSASESDVYSALDVYSTLTSKTGSSDKTALLTDEFSAQRENKKNTTAPEEVEHTEQHAIQPTLTVTPDSLNTIPESADEGVGQSVYQNTDKKITTTPDQVEKNASQSKSHNTDPKSATAPDKVENSLEQGAAIGQTLITEPQPPVVFHDVQQNNTLAPKETISSAKPDTGTLPLFRETKIEILSDHIERFVITSSVQNYEPVGTIRDITFDINNIATVYAYSDVSELQGKTIYYLWTLDGKKQAKVRVDIGSSRWRSHSSKFIRNYKHGEWQVELHSEGGEKLASIQFIY